MSTTPDHPEDPFDVLARSIPRHLWLSLSIVLVTTLIGLLFFDPLPSTLPEGGELNDTVQTLEARVVEVLGEEAPAGMDRPGYVQTVRVEILQGQQRGEQVEIRHGEGEAIGEEGLLRVGDRVLVEYSSGTEGERYYVSDFVRWPVLLAMAIVFGVAVVAVGGMVGLRALISMGFSVLILATFIIPGILAGHDPLVITLFGSVALLASSLYLTYGAGLKTHAALVGLVISLGMTSGLALFFVYWLRLSGLGSESAMFLRFGEGLEFDLRGILLAGIIIGSLGVLDDVTTNQSAVVFELSRVAPGLSAGELFRRSMVVGRDHIAAIVNTLLLAYTGASLTLLLLMVVQSASLGQTLSRAFMVEELTRTLVGSLGLVLATPITTLIAVWLVRRRGPQGTDQALAKQMNEGGKDL